MNGFLILFFIAASTADQLGYNYQQSGQNFAIGGIGFIGNDIGSHGPDAIDIRSGTIGNSFGTADAFGGGFGGFNGVNNANGLGVGGYSGYGGDSGLENNELSATNLANYEFQKEFYSFTAPDEEFNDQDTAQQATNSMKKNLRVIFIRTPENQALTNAALQLVKQGSGDHTAIYVLTKQADVGEFANKLQALKSGNSYKPEVHFVKYRTKEDAAHAQHVIQSQYDALGGQSHVSNEDVAPVLNFASPTTVNGGYASSSAGFGGISTGTGSTGHAGYLPPAFRFF